MKEKVLKMKSLVMRFLDNECSTHAAGLTYFSLLAVVPILCCMLVVARACKVDEYARNQINERIDTLIASIEQGQDDPMLQYLPAETEEQREKKRYAAQEFATQARAIANGLFKQVDKFDIGTLGWIGFAFLLWTVISSLASVEASFNKIFEVPKPRPIWKRSYMYLLIMIVLPVLAAVAMSLPILNVLKNVIISTLGASSLTRWAGDGIIWMLDCTVFRLAVTFALASFFFTFFYWIIPNCRVRVKSAAIGGMLTTLFFGGWIKACALAQVGIAKSSALYGSFAFLPIVLAWLYMSWQIVLFGACVVKEVEGPREETK